MLYIKFQVYMPFCSRNEDFEGSTLYGHVGNPGHVTNIILITFLFISRHFFSIKKLLQDTVINHAFLYEEAHYRSINRSVILKCTTGLSLNVMST